VEREEQVVRARRRRAAPTPNVILEHLVRGTDIPAPTGALGDADLKALVAVVVRCIGVGLDGVEELLAAVRGYKVPELHHAPIVGRVDDTVRTRIPPRDRR